MAYKDVILADGPAGYWPLDEPSGTTAVDASTGGNNGTYINTPTLGAAGPVAGHTAVTFAGASDQYVAPSMPAFNHAQATVEAWVYIPAAPGISMTIAGCMNSPGGATTDKDLYIDTTGSLRFYAYDGGLQHTPLPAAPIPFNQWVHVVGVADGTSLIAYVNGTSVASIACGATFTGYAGPNTFIAAAVPQVGATYFTGRIGQAAFYPAALSPVQIAAHYAARLSGATWHGPFSPGTLFLRGVGIVRVSTGDTVTLTQEQSAGVAASDPDWWTLG